MIGACGPEQAYSGWDSARLEAIVFFAQQQERVRRVGALIYLAADDPVRAQRDDGGKPAALHSLWSQDPAGKTLLAIDVFECKSVKAAHDQLLEVLGQMQSGVVERQTGKSVPGDVAFGYGKAMALFARANMVVLIRNAGPTVVPVDAIARTFDALVIKRLGRKARG